MNHILTADEFISFAQKHSNQKVLGVIGFPISHSQSPKLHQAAYQHNKIPAHYAAIEIQTSRELINFLEQTEKIPNILGFNITIPYKNDVFKRYPSEKYNLIGATNTLIKCNNQWISENTDWLGFLEPIKTHTFENALLLGWGGAASAVVYALQQLNPNMAIDIVSRRNISFNDSNIRTLFSDYLTIKNIQSKYGIIINTTPLGLVSKSENFKLDFLKQLPNTNIAYDLIYNPVETQFLSYFKSIGSEIINGLPMFIEQASQAHKLWFNSFFSEPIKQHFINSLTTRSTV